MEKSSGSLLKVLFGLEAGIWLLQVQFLLGIRNAEASSCHVRKHSLQFCTHQKAQSRTTSLVEIRLHCLYYIGLECLHVLKSPE